MSKRIAFLVFLLLGFYIRSSAQAIQAPWLQCVTNSTANNDITLSWTDPPNNGCGPFQEYTIYWSPNGPNGPWDSASVSSQAATTYTVTLSPSSTWYFYMVAKYNCPGATFLHSDTVNNLNPAVPQIIDVTVTPSGQAVINWAPSTSPQTSSYRIYYYLPNGTASIIDTVYGRLNTTDIDPLGNPTTQSLVYTIAALDSCGNISSFNTKPQNTIYTKASITDCQRQLNVEWNKYINWPQGVYQYQLWVSQNGSQFFLAGTGDSLTFTYSYTNFNDGDSVQLFIRALSAADTNVVSNSNVVRMIAKIVQPPAYYNITNLTVNLQNQIEVTWLTDTMAQLVFFDVLRGTDTFTMNILDQIPATKPVLHFQTLVDSNYVFPSNNPYFYKIVDYDSCQNTFTTPIGETVNLQGELYDFYVAHLTWNNFVLQYTTVKQYNLYRDMGSGYQLIKSFPPGTNEYFDSLQQFLSAKGTFCYRVEAAYDINIPAPANYSDALSSFSNVVCVIHRPIIYVPNAFAPEGLNNVFKPTIIYGNPQGYSMIIFNRWGGKVFETQDPQVGWDGTDHGKAAQLGGYSYLIQFTADDGANIERKGIVLLVR